MSQTPEVKKLIVLGTALREARLEQRPTMTLKELGGDDRAPRRWSHSHLSKVERGIEAPNEELVRWYEDCTGRPRGYLLDLYHAAVGRSARDVAESPEGRTQTWALDRTEIFANLSGSDSLIYDTRDLVAIADRTKTYVVHLDSIEQAISSEIHTVELLDGGVLGKRKRISSTLSTVEIRLHRKFDAGEWHRIRLLHRAPAMENLSPWMTVATRRGETREALVAVRFNKREVRPMWRIDAMPLSEIVPAFEKGTSARVEDFADACSRVFPDANGIVHSRFPTLRSGLHYGIGWR